MIDIEQLKALERAATPGPWETVDDVGPDCSVCAKNGVERHAIRAGDCSLMEEGHDAFIPEMPDLQFLVAARNALPELLALLEEARELAQGCVEGGVNVVVSEDIGPMARAFLAKFTQEKK